MLTYCSNDDGDSWRASQVIDLGRSGYHSGTIETALEELQNGRQAIHEADFVPPKKAK